MRKKVPKGNSNFKNVKPRLHIITQILKFDRGSELARTKLQ